MRSHATRLMIPTFAAALLATSVGALAQSGAVMLRSSAITGGGAASSGPGFAVTGVVGALEAGPMSSGGSFSVSGGFVAAIPPTRFGDVNCDRVVNSIDGLFVLQLDVGLRGTNPQCPPQTAGTLFAGQCNVSGDNACNSIDALFILQCDVGLRNALCP